MEANHIKEAQNRLILQQQLQQHHQVVILEKESKQHADELDRQIHDLADRNFTHARCHERYC
jgi:hypothetical protein